MTQNTGEELAPTLTAKDLKGFDRRRVALIREMEAFGWRGRRGTKNHVLMRAPDGVTTTGVSSKVISPKNEHDVRRDFVRWLRQQEEAQRQMAFPSADATSVLVALTVQHRPDLPEIMQEGTSFAAAADDPATQRRKPRTPIVPEIEAEPVDTAPEPVAVERNDQVCGLCEKAFDTFHGLSVHRVRSHSRVSCEVCDRPLPPGNLPRHLRGHVEAIGTHEQAMRRVLQLEAEISRIRDEANGWERIADEIEDRYTEIKDRMDSAVGYLLGSS